MKWQVICPAMGPRQLPGKGVSHWSTEALQSPWQSLYAESCLSSASRRLWKTFRFSFASPAAAEVGLGKQALYEDVHISQPLLRMKKVGSPQCLTIFQKHRQLLPILFQSSSPVRSHTQITFSNNTKRTEKLPEGHKHLCWP